MEREKLEAFVRMHGKYVRGVALRFTRRTDLAQDVESQVWLNILRAKTVFEERASVKTWLYHVTKNAAISMLARERIRHPRVDQEFADPDNRLLGVYSFPGYTRQDPEKALEGKDAERALRACVTQLSEDHREVFVLRYLEGASYSEIADRTGTPEGTVKSRLSRATREVVTLLRELGYQLEI